MKTLTALFALIPALLLISWIPASKEISSISWTSNQYKDMETGDLISMTNEFECTPDALSWSLFEGALPVSKVEWTLNDSDQGFIKYHIASSDLNGTVTFFLGSSSRAETDLKSDVGRLQFKFRFSNRQMTTSHKDSYALMGN